MATKGEAYQTINGTADQAYSTLRKNLNDKGYEVVKEENYKLADGTNVRTVVGNTSRLGGTTLLSAYFQGTRNVPFYVTLKEKGNQTEVSATALGSESVLKFDWGRNKKVAENLVGYCNTAAPSAASTGSDYDSSSNSTGKPAQTNAQKPQQK